MLVYLSNVSLGPVAVGAGISFSNMMEAGLGLEYWVEIFGVTEANRRPCGNRGKPRKIGETATTWANHRGI